ncbi:NAD(P)H-dependent oxidoreductase [Maribellus mangrovi]|uniref:NAD(P)H-dependent oxidoreductase n=1 Tax=Maribellus mangrovi TaxID=3133146 RepID=UPI0030EC4ACD
MKKILIIFAHPAIQKSIINKTLIDAVKDLKGVTVNDLYENYPDFFIDVEKEQRLLLEHDVIIWHHPFYWYNAPALFKEWMDLVLQHGFAYGRTGRALEGKWVMSAISTGGQQEVYSKTGSNRFTVNEFLAPFDRSVTLCRMIYLPPFVTYGSHTITKEKLKQQAKDYAEVITSLRDGKFNAQDFLKADNMNHLIANYA